MDNLWKPKQDKTITSNPFTPAEKKYAIVYGGNEVQVSQSQVDWMRDRYQKSFSNAYKASAADTERYISGEMPSTYEKSYSKSNIDQQLFKLGLPSTKYLGQFMQDYDTWYGDGSKYTFDKSQSDFLSKEYRKTWKYSFDPEDQVRQKEGKIPLALEKTYGDNYTDYNLMQNGLPPSSKLGDFVNAYNTRVGQSSRIAQFYSTLSTKVYGLSLQGVENNDATREAPVVNVTDKGAVGFGVNPDKNLPAGQKIGKSGSSTQSLSGQQEWEDAYWNQILSPEWADLLPLHKDAQKNIDSVDYKTTEDYRKAQVKLALSQAASADDDSPFVSYDDFLDFYNVRGGKKAIQQSSIVDQALIDYGINTVGDYEQAVTEERKAAQYNAINSRPAARSFADSIVKSNPNFDGASVLQDMFDNGVGLTQIQQAMSVLRKNAQDDAARAAIDEKYAALREYRPAQYGAAAPVSFPALFGREEDKTSAAYIAKQKYGILSKEYADAVNADTRKNMEASVEIIALEKQRRKEDARIDKLIQDGIVGAYDKTLFTTVSRESAAKIADKYVSFDGEVPDAESVEAAKKALAAEGLNQREIEIAISENISERGGSSLLQRAFEIAPTLMRITQGDVPTLINETIKGVSAIKNAIAKPDASALEIKGMFDDLRSRGVMSGLKLDNAIRRAGYSYMLDPVESAKNYFLEVHSVQSGLKPAEAVKWWDSLSDSNRQLYVENFERDSASNPLIHKTVDDVLTTQGVTSVLPKILATVADAGVGVAGLVVNDPNKDAQWVKDASEWIDSVRNFGRSDQSLVTKGISFASDAASELAIMYGLNAAGGAIMSGAGSKLAAAASSKGASFLTKAAASTLRSSPFLARSFGSYYAEAVKSGAPVDQAKWYALVAGGFEGWLESWTLDKTWGRLFGSENLAKAIKDGGETALTSGLKTQAKLMSLATSFFGEASEEAISYSTSWAMSAAQGWNKDAFSMAELGNQALMGGIIGMLGGALTAPSMSARNILAEYIVESGEYKASNNDLLLSAVIASGVTDDMKAQYSAQGTGAIMSVKDYSDNQQALTNGRTQLIQGKQQYETELSRLTSQFQDTLARSVAAESLVKQMDDDPSVGVGSEKYLTALKASMKIGSSYQVEVKYDNAVQKLKDAYRNTTDQQNRSIEKAKSRMLAHHVAMMDLFSPEIDALRNAVTADKVKRAAFGTYLSTDNTINSVADVANLDELGASAYNSAVSSRNDALAALEAAGGVSKASAVQSVIDAKMNAFRAGNAKDFIDAQTANQAQITVDQALADQPAAEPTSPQGSTEAAPVEPTAATPATGLKQPTKTQSVFGIVDPRLTETVDAMRKFGRDAYKRLVSGASGIERASRAQKKFDVGGVTVEDLAQGLRNATGTQQYILQDALIDINGTEIGDSFVKVFGMIPNELQADFQKYLLARHTESRMTLEDRGYGPNKPVLASASGAVDPDGNPTAMDANEAAALSAQLETEHPEFVSAKEALQTSWRNFYRSWAVDGGFITEDQFNRLQEMYPDYVPTYRVDKNAPAGSGSVTRNSVSISSVMHDATGSLADVQDIRVSIADMVKSYVKGERRNELVQNLYGFAETSPNDAAEYAAIFNDVSGVTPEVDYVSFDELANESAAEVRDGNYIIRGWRGGDRISMYVNKDVYDAFNYLMNPADVSVKAAQLSEVEQGARKITKPIKAAITGYNPFFGLTNVMRDVQTYAMNTNATAIDSVTNLGRAVAGMTQNSADWRNYLALGGNSSGFITSQMMTDTDVKGMSKAKKAVDTAKHVMGFVGSQTENMFRFAEYLDGVKKYGDTPEGRRKAIAGAADVTVNFSRSGAWTKAADAVCLYLNANVQGLDKMARTIKNNPGRTALRGLSLAAIGVLLRYITGNDKNPHYENLTNYTKDSNFLIPNVLGKRDENGYPTTFIKIPKSREYGTLLVATVERAARFADGEKFEDAFADLGADIKTSIGVQLRPFWSDAEAIKTNKNFFGSDIVPAYMQSEAAPDQTTAQTSVISDAISERLYEMSGKEVSPMILDYITNQYGGFYGQMLTSVTAKDSGGFLSALGNAVTDKFVADPLYQSGVVSRFYDATDDAQSLARASQRQREQYGLSASSKDETAYDVLLDYKSSISKLRKQERELLASEKDTPSRKSKIDAIREQINKVAAEGLAAWNNR